MGDFGVGSRGMGDFYTHEKIAQVIGKTSAIVDLRILTIPALFAPMGSIL